MHSTQALPLLLLTKRSPCASVRVCAAAAMSASASSCVSCSRPDHLSVQHTGAFAISDRIVVN
eukprot:5616475-Prymnesium_polylepis.2